MLEPAAFFDLNATTHADLFAGCQQVWQALAGLKNHVQKQLAEEGNGLLLPAELGRGVPLAAPLVIHGRQILSCDGLTIEYGSTDKGELVVQDAKGQRLDGASVIMAGAILLGNGIKIGRGVLIESGALIKAPTLIGDQTEIRQAAYLRGNCVLGRCCVAGHATEVKHSVFLDGAKAGHFAYLGDSILGRDVNLGAGTKCANLRFVPGNVMVNTPEGRMDSGLRKFGAILGDGVQTGCNSVTSPGTVIGPGSFLMPNATAASGVYPPKTRLR